MNGFLLGLLLLQEAKPERPEAPASPPKIRVDLGPEEFVFRWQKDRCAETDITDVYVRAFRNHKDEIVLVSGNAPDNHFMFGPGFKGLKRGCKPVMRSHDSPLAETFDNQEWVASTYTLDGRTVYAMIHNEFHDPKAGPPCRKGVTDPSNRCWYNSINFGISTDGGRSFTHAPAPGHLMISPFGRWDPKGNPRPRGGGFDPPVYGALAPSNIIKGTDGFFYCLFFALPDPARAGLRGICLVRSDDLADPKSWRMWDGEGFGSSFSNPYAPGWKSPKFAFVGHPHVGDMSGSLTYNTYLERYILVGTNAAHRPDGSVYCGFFFSLSEDLIHWSPIQLVREAVLGFPHCPSNGRDLDQYPSLIDHEDTTRNFERTGRRPYLYFNRWYQGAGRNSYDRDLLRVRLTFTKE